MEHKDLTRSSNGFLVEDVAQTAYTIWSRCSGNPAAWESADQFAWLRLAQRAIVLIDGLIETEATFSHTELAKSLFSWAFGSDTNSTLSLREKFHAAPLDERLVWEAVGRHLVNCLDAEAGAVSLSEHENRAVAWFRRKLSLQGVSA